MPELGMPLLSFHPYDYGDPWTKLTYVWGRFRPPMKEAIPAGVVVDPTTHHRRSMADRSETPPGFARAFFEANP